MQTLWRNSKKCLTAELAVFVGLTCCFCATSQPVFAGTPLKTGTALMTQIKGQLRARNSVEFKTLLNRWEKDYGTRAVKPLIQLARDRNLPDPDRYIALMGSAKLGGKGIAPNLVTFLKDPSWMIRNGALRALGALNDAKTAPHVLKLLNDPALVVRLEAVDAVEKMRPANASTALLRTIRDKANYHGNKAQWVPQRALEALAELGDKSVAKELAPLLDRHDDPALLRTTLGTLEKITGRKLASSRPLRERAGAWKRELTGKRD